MPIEYVKGNLFDGNERAFAHGCNCHGVMGAGFAKQVKSRFPTAYREYRRAHGNGQFYPGVAQPVACFEGDSEDYSNAVGEMTLVYNLATQNFPGANAKLWMVEQAFKNMKIHMGFTGNSRVAIPKIASDIGGLEWSDVEDVIRQVMCFPTNEFTVVVYEL